MSVIIVHGLASGRKTRLEYLASEADENLLLWLRRKGITIASSCNAEGICRKCVIQNGELSCLFTVGSFAREYPNAVVEIAYL